jgi:hypothetical protein
MWTKESKMKVESFLPGWTVLIAVMGALLASQTPVSAVTHYVDEVWELEYWAVQCAPYDEIVIAPGTYNMTKCLYMQNKQGVTVRGQTGVASDVVLWGGGMNNTSAIEECFQFVSTDMTLADLTIEGYYNHAVHFQPAGDRCIVDNVTTLNIGEQHMKGAVNNDDCIIRNCKLYQTEARVCRPDHPVSPCNYIGGIDLHGARRCEIYDNVVMDIMGADDGGDGGIFLWNASQNCVIERNVVIGCCKGIELGNPSDQGVWQVQDSIVRNNFVLSRPNEDIGIELCYTLNCKVYNNTVYRTGAPGSQDWNRTFHIDDNRFHETTNLDIQNNIIRGGITDHTYSGGWTAAAVEAMGNIVDVAGTLVLPEWFVDPDNLNLHLTELAIAAINAAVTLADVPEDIDRGPRPAGDFPDMGADEYGSPAGDANYDGKVDGLDYNVWSLHYQQAGNWGDGNFNSDALVDGLDYNVWSLNYGFGEGSHVPEPAFALLLTAGLGPILRRRRNG